MDIAINAMNNDYKNLFLNTAINETTINEIDNEHKNLFLNTVINDLKNNTLKPKPKPSQKPKPKPKNDNDDDDDDDDDDDNYIDDDDDSSYVDENSENSEKSSVDNDDEDTNNNIPQLFIFTTNQFSTTTNKRKRNGDNNDKTNDKIKNKYILNKKQKHCNNPKCDHKMHNEKWYEQNKIDVKEITSLKYLLELGDCFHCQMRKEYNGINLENLFNAKEHINNLINMIGLTNIKDDVLDNIIYFLLNKNKNDMLHGVITGDPGCGKTTFVNILAKIYSSIGVLKKGHVINAKRCDLIGQYLGDRKSVV